MAIFHLNTKPVSRSKGRSSIAASAYRNACKMTDERTGLEHDYTKKKGVVISECLAKNMHGDLVAVDRSKLWNLAEKSEKRKDARTAREIIVNLPYELSDNQRHMLVYDFIQELVSEYDVAIDFAIHLPDKHGDQRNHHAHILMTTRKATFENNELKLHEKTRLELSNAKLEKMGLPKTQEQIKMIREKFANVTNALLEMNKVDARIDHRSFAERGIDKVPTIKLGRKTVDSERKGIKTPKGDINRAIRADNQKIDMLKNQIDDIKKESTQTATFTEQHQISEQHQVSEQHHVFESEMNDVDALIDNRAFIAEAVSQFNRMSENNKYGSHQYVKAGHIFDVEQMKMLDEFTDEIRNRGRGDWQNDVRYKIAHTANRDFFIQHKYMLALAQNPSAEREYRKEQNLSNTQSIVKEQKTEIPSNHTQTQTHVLRRPR
jgi:hypothetical protein